MHCGPTPVPGGDVSERSLDLPKGGDDPCLHRFCADVFGSLTRADQRRWASVYVNGLATLPGRKSIRRIADDAGPGTTDQSLQQFVNQSPWDHTPVRQALAARAAELAEPAAIVVEEVVFAKHGRFSPGVERQYVRSIGRVSNCQLGLSISLAGRSSVPIEWRLMLPASWDQDEARRRKAYVPPEERHKPCWQHTMVALDEVSQWLGMPTVPVVAEAPVAAEAAALLAAIEDHRYECVLRVPGSMPATVEDLSVAHVPRALPGGPPVTRTAPLSELVRAAAGHRRTLTWTKPDGNVARSQFVSMAVQPAPGEPRPGRTFGSPARMLVAEWPMSRPEPTAYWLSNMVDHRPAELVHLAKLRGSAQESVAEMGRHFGLWDFEGRSFRGWHHHVTLSTAAYVLHLDAKNQSGPAAERCRTGFDDDAG